MSPRMDDLSPADQAAVRRALAGQQGRTRARLSRAGSSGAEFPARCSCGLSGPFSRVEKHANEAHHGARIEVLQVEGGKQ